MREFETGPRPAAGFALIHGEHDIKIAVNKTFLKVLLVIAGFGFMVVYAGGFLSRKTAPDALPVSYGAPVPVDATILEVNPSAFSPSVDVVGTTASDRRIQISSRLSAYVDEVFVRAGDSVTNGQVLVLLDQRELKEQLVAAEAQLNQASAEFRRTRKLYEGQATTEQAVTAAESAYRSAKANVDRIAIMLSYATISSPINGIITERSVEAGDLASPGQLLLGLYDPRNMRLEVPVPVRLIRYFTLGQKVKAALDHPARTYDAEVTEIVGEIEPATRTQRVKLRLLDTDNDVLPGAFGRIKIEETSRPALLIPSAAVFQIGQLSMVQVIKNDLMIQRLVRTGTRSDDRIEIISGLSNGDRVVVPAAKD